MIVATSPLKRNVSRRLLLQAALSGLALAGCATISPADAAAPARLPGVYDPDGILARTIRGEVPAVKLYEDSHVLAFLGDRPAARGHFLVLSKTSTARNFLEMDGASLGRIMRAAQRVARAEIAALGAEGFTLRQNNGSASSIHQFHLHVIPRWRGDALSDGPQPAVSLETLEPMAARIRAAIV